MEKVWYELSMYEVVVDHFHCGANPTAEITIFQYQALLSHSVRLHINLYKKTIRELLLSSQLFISAQKDTHTAALSHTYTSAIKPMYIDILRPLLKMKLLFDLMWKEEKHERMTESTVPVKILKFSQGAAECYTLTHHTGVLM